MIEQQLTGFIAAPFDPNGDGKTSLWEWVAFVGLIVVLVRIWTYFLDQMFD